MSSFNWHIMAALMAFTLAAGGAQDRPKVNVYAGMCDASAAVSLDSRLFAVANDEDNVLRVYDVETNGLPKATLDLNQFLRVGRSKNPETDFEGAAWLDGRIFWVTSHGRNRDGKLRESRHRFFATSWVTNQGAPRLEPVGRAYEHLLRDLVREPRLSRFNLRRASTLAPKLPGAFNIEGLCATPEGHLLLGFRNPVPNNRALIVPLLNPGEIITGRAARFGDPVTLDLGGLGIRDLAWIGDTYVIIAGPYHGGGQSQLFRWGGTNQAPTSVEHASMKGFNPEAIVAYENRPGLLQLLSDDGTRKKGGVACKDLPNPADRTFRSFWISVQD